MTYELLKTLNLDTLEDRHTKVCDCAIKKNFGFHFQLQWEHKCKAISKNAQWKNVKRISKYNQDE